MTKLITANLNTYRQKQPVYNATYYLENKKNNNYQKKSLYTNTLATSALILGGGILLYLGFKPSSQTIEFRKVVKEKLLNMNNISNNFIKSINSILNDAFKTSDKELNKYKMQISTAKEYFPIIKSLKSTKEILEFQNKIFEQLYDKNKIQVGKSKLDILKSYVYTDFKKFKDTLNRTHHATRLELEDCAYLPPLKGIIKERIKKAAQIKLNTHKDELLSKLYSLPINSANIIMRTKFEAIKNMINQEKTTTMKTKEDIINYTFQRIKEIENLDDTFQPICKKIPEIKTYKELDRKALQILKRLCKKYKTNYFIGILENLKNTKLSPEAFKDIIKKSNNESIEDLAFLIDRIRLQQAVEKTNKYDDIINNLEYLFTNIKDSTH